MKRALIALISLYPKHWRNRYKNEYSALLDEVPPTWRTFFDVFGGAVKMQMKMGSAWKPVAAFAVTGAIAAGVFSLTVPDRYMSTAVISVGDARPDLIPGFRTIQSRASLTRLITDEDLYKSERTREPIEDIVEQMKRDIAIRPVGAKAFSISFVGPDAAHAQRVTQRLSTAFIDAEKAGQVLDPASLPVTPSDPRRSRIVIMGSIAGVIVGAVFAFFNGLRVWKLAAAFGIGGMLLGLAPTYFVHSLYRSTAIVHIEGRDTQNQLGRAIDSVKSDDSLGAMIDSFGLYPKDSGALQKMRENLRMTHNRDASVVIVQFNYSDRYMARRIAADAVSRLFDGLIRDESPRVSPGVTLELMDPASLPLNPYFPKRLSGAGAGLVLGLTIATMVGIRGRRRMATQIV